MTLRHILIVPLLFILAACFVCCSGRSTIASEIERPTDTVMVVQQLEEQSETETEKTPLDTIVFELPDSKKLQLFVFSYYDSLPRRPIKDFILKDMLSGEIVLRADTTKLILVDEVDHFTGEIDTFKMVPAYYVNQEELLKIELSVFMEGNLGYGYIKNIICNLKYQDDDQRKRYINLLAYEFRHDVAWHVTSNIEFLPCACTSSSEEIWGKFQELKAVGHLDTRDGDNVLKEAFICFSNNHIDSFESILKEFIKTNNNTFSPYYYYTYIAYLYGLRFKAAN